MGAGNRRRVNVVAALFLNWWRLVTYMMDMTVCPFFFFPSTLDERTTPIRHRTPTSRCHPLALSIRHKPQEYASQEGDFVSEAARISAFVSNTQSINVTLRTSSGEMSDSAYMTAAQIDQMAEIDLNRKINVIKHRKKKAANDAQLLMYVPFPDVHTYPPSTLTPPSLPPPLPHVSPGTALRCCKRKKSGHGKRLSKRRNVPWKFW